MTGQRIDLEINPITFRFHCPLCGHAILVPEQEPSPCDHCTFIWVDAIGEFDEAYCDADILERVKVAPEPEDEPEEGEFSWASCFDDDFLERLPDATVAFYLTWNFIACGPNSETIVIGIDGSYESDENDDEDAADIEGAQA
jgi:hypothetical protein